MGGGDVVPLTRNRAVALGPAITRAGRNVAEQKEVSPVPDRTLGEFETAGHDLDRRIGRYEIRESSGAEHVHLGIPAYRDIAATTLTAEGPP